MKPWLTPTVLALMQGIDAEKAYDRLPVLADALEDAGFADQAALAALRVGDPALCGPWYRRVAEGAETVERVRQARAWLTEHGRTLGTDPYGAENPDDDRSALEPGEDPFAWIMESCRRYADDGEGTYFGYDTPDEAFERAGEMWSHYQVLTGKRPPDEGGYPPTPYRCAC